MLLVPLEIELFIRVFSADLRQRYCRRTGVELHRRRDLRLSHRRARRSRAFYHGRLNSSVTRILRIAVRRSPFRSDFVRIHVALVIGLPKLSLHKFFRRRHAVMRTLLPLHRCGGISVAEFDNAARLFDGDDSSSILRRFVHPHSFFGLCADRVGERRACACFVKLLLRSRRRVRDLRR